MIALFGLGATAVYIATTMAGSFLDPSYSQVRQHVSDLTGTGASTWAVLAPLYVLYNLLMSAFAVELYAASDRGRLHRFGLMLLLVNAFAGVMMVTAFREDAGGLPTTLAGTGHFVFAGVSALAVIIASLVYGFAFRRSSVWRSLSTFSFVVAGAFLVLGWLGVALANTGVAGLAERGPIGLLLLWLGVVAISTWTNTRVTPDGPKSWLGPRAWVRR